MLPPATKKTLGGVIIGKGLKVNDAGVAQVDEAGFAKVPSAANADLAWAANRLRREEVSKKRVVSWTLRLLLV